MLAAQYSSYIEYIIYYYDIHQQKTIIISIKVHG